MRDEFEKYHPTVNITFYAFVIGITMFHINPICIGISLVASVIYLCIIKKGNAVTTLVGMLAVFVIAMVVNPLFSHRGITVLFYLPTGNAVTMEAVVYGIVSGMRLVAVLIWFVTFNVVISSDKIMSVFGKILPIITLIFTMVLRFVPKFVRHARDTSNANRQFNNRNEDGIFTKIKMQSKNFSITTTWALETSIDTADSMKARGYGIGRRTNYNDYKIAFRDVVVLSIMLVTGIYQIARINLIECVYYPSIYINTSKTSIFMYGIFAVLCLMPIIINIVEEVRWYKLKLKI